MDLYLKNKTVIVTGGIKGIGSGISQVFAEEGANLIIDYRSNDELAESFVMELKKKYSNENIYSIKADVSKVEDVSRIFDFAEDKFGGLDVLINNAGGGSAYNDVIQNVSDEKWQGCMNDNINGQFYMCREFARRLIAAQRGGRIVNVLSKASMSTTSIGHGPYVVSKHAELGLVRQLAVDLTQYGIICNGIMPGSVRNSRYTPEKEGVRKKRSPLGRVGEPYEFGKMVAFLASEQCTLAVGSAVDYTGGMLLGF